MSAIAATITTLPLVGVALGTTACAGRSTQPAAPTPTARPVAAAPPPRRCPSSSDVQPRDASSRMTSLETAVRRCFALGTTSAKYGGTVELKLVVAETGHVRSAKITQAGGAHPGAVECTQAAARGARFAKFCGDDVGITWKYMVQ